MAADEVCGYLGLQSRWAGELSEGKMFGVLIVRTGDGGIAYLAAFSGNLAHRNRHDCFVPPVFDFLQPDGYFIAGERLVSQLNQRIDDIRSSAVYTSLKALITNEEALAAQEIAHTVKVY